MKLECLKSGLSYALCSSFQLPNQHLKVSVALVSYKHLLFPSSDGIYFDGLNLYCTVCLVCRVGGVLIPTRSFGDFLLKSEQDKPAWKQVISVVPQIQTFKLDSCWEFIVVGSDGVWDAMSNAEMTNFVKGRLTSATSHLSSSRKPGQVYGWTPTQLPPSWH